MKETFEVVVSGISGMFPECSNVQELEINLFDKVDMVKVDGSSWEPGMPIPKGHLKNPNVLDWAFCSVPKDLCSDMDTYTKLTLEHSYAAICDAGLNPVELSGSYTAVVMGSSICEQECSVIQTNNARIRRLILGQNRAMQSNRVSFFLNLKGPSYTIDSSWNGGAQVLHDAFNFIAQGHCTAALVGIVSLTYRSELDGIFESVYSLSKDGTTRCFSADAQGYARSEGCVMLFLQRADLAKRSYGTIRGLAIQSCNLEHKSLMSFDGDANRMTLVEAYKKSGVDPKDVSYIEANGYGDKVVDALELNSIADVTLKNRTSPLYVGSIKSNLGHAEGAAALVSVAKALIILKRGKIPANLHYSRPNPNVPALLSGQIRVPTSEVPLEGSIIGVSCHSFGDYYSHVVLEQSKTTKLKEDIDELPRMLIISGRDEDRLNRVIDELNHGSIDKYQIALTQEIFRTEIRGHIFRGYNVFDHEKSSLYKCVKPYEGGKKKPVWFLFSGMGSQWTGMGRELMKVPLCAESFHRCHEYLESTGTDLINILTTDDPKIFDSIVNCFVGIAAIQIALVDLLTAVGVKPDGIIGHSVGELGCAYADGCFSAREMILSAYYRGKASIETKLEDGLMAAVGLGYNNIKDRLPETIEVACHNSSTSSTLSGMAAAMKDFVAQLQSENVFARLVNTGNIAYHSQYIKPAAPSLLRYLKELIKDPKPRSPRWVSTSVLQTAWESRLAQFCSAEYQTNNLLSPVYFEETCAHVPSDAILIEIAPHGLLQAIVTRSLPSCTHIPLTNRLHKANVNFLLNALGKMYLAGIELDLTKLYPKITYPVPRETSYIHHLITFNHSEQYDNSDMKDNSSVSFKKYQISLSDESFFKLNDFKINGAITLPSAMYIDFVVDVFKNVLKKPHGKVTLEKFHLKKHLEIYAKPPEIINVVIQPGSGKFQISNNANAILVTGIVKELSKEDEILIKADSSDDEDQFHDQHPLDSYDIYNCLSGVGMDVTKHFALIDSAKISAIGMKASVVWNGAIGDFITALFTLMTFHSCIKNKNKLKLVTYIDRIVIDNDYFSSLPKQAINVTFDSRTNKLSCPGLIILNTSLESYSEFKNDSIMLRKTQFLPYFNCKVHSLNWMLKICAQIVSENLPSDTLDAVFYDSYDYTKESFLTDMKQELIDVNAKFCYTEDQLMKHLDQLDCAPVWVVCLHDFPKGALFDKLKDSFILAKQDEFTSDSEFKMCSFTLNSTEYVLIRKISNTVDIEIKNEAQTRDVQAENSSNIKKLCIVHPVHDYSKVIDAAKKTETSDNYLFVDKLQTKIIAKDPFFASQIEKNLKVNVLQNDKWGSLRKVPLDENVDSSSLAVQKYGKHSFPMSEIRCEVLAITALSPNESDFSNCRPCKKIKFMDFAGLNGDGKQVMGVCTLANGNNMTLDEHFIWEQPSGWSDEEAASVPMIYAAATHVLSTLEGRSESILVHKGALPLSQAIINLALGQHCQVFTTYESEEERRVLKSLFFDKVIMCNTKEFPKIIKSHHKDGVKLLINSTNDKMCQLYNTKVISSFGHFVETNCHLVKTRASIGMSVFLKFVGASGMTGKILMNLTGEKKEGIKRKMSEAIKAGWVKPIKFEKYGGSTRNTEILASLRSVTAQGKKIVVKRDSQATHKLDVHSPKKCIILGDLKLFLELIEWLGVNGANDIHVAMTKTARDNVLESRLKNILERFPTLNISILSASKLNNLSKVQKFAEKNIAGNENLWSAFFIGSDVKEFIEIFDEVLNDVNIPFVFIGQGGEATCEERTRRNLQSLCVRCTNTVINARMMKKLDTLLSSSNLHRIVDAYCPQNHSSEQMNWLNVFPRRIKDLVQIQEPSEIQLFEIPTKSLPYEQRTENDPIFLIPGVNRSSMLKLAGELFYPAFEARFPKALQDVNDQVDILTQKIMNFPQRCVTIIASDFGTVLGLMIAHQLEKNDRKVCLVMLHQDPITSIKYSLKIVNKMFGKLVSSYFPGVIKANDIRNDWSTIQNLIKSSSLKDNEKIQVESSLLALKNKLVGLAYFDLPEFSLNSTCHLVKPTDLDDSMMKKICKGKYFTYKMDDDELSESRKTIQLINSLALLDFRVGTKGILEFNTNEWDNMLQDL